MRIGIDIRTLADGKTTGVEVYTASLVQALAAHDRNNKYVLFFNARRSECPISPGNGCDNISISSYSYPNRLLNLSMLTIAQPKIDRMAGGVDVFFSPRYLFTALSQSCPLVVTMHDISFVYNPNFFSLRQRLWHKIVADRAACRAAASVIAVSHSTRADLISQFGIPGNKIRVVYPGIDHSKFNILRNSMLEASIRTRYTLPESYILFLGTIEPRKNILGIIAAYELLRRTHITSLPLVLAGGLGWLYRTILARIEASPFRSDIRLLNRISEEDKPSLYRMASLFVFPSFYEGFGFPPLEASACGIPSVVSMNSSFPEVMESAPLYVNPYSTWSIAEAMRQIICSPDLALKMREDGIRRAEYFTWERTAAETREVLESTVNKRL